MTVGAILLRGRRESPRGEPRRFVLEVFDDSGRKRKGVATDVHGVGGELAALVEEAAWPTDYVDRGDLDLSTDAPRQSAPVRRGLVRFER